MFGMPVGIYVYKIVEGGAASSSDLKEKDIITKFDGQSVTNMEELKQMLTYYEAGSRYTHSPVPGGRGICGARRAGDPGNQAGRPELMNLMDITVLWFRLCMKRIKNISKKITDLNWKMCYTNVYKLPRRYSL